MQINSYFVGQENDKIKILIELLDKEGSNLSTFYYELVLRIKGGKLNRKYYEIDSITEINNIFNYLFSNFNGNIKRRKLNTVTNNYLIRMLNFQTYKKGFNERLSSRVSSYYDKNLKALEEDEPQTPASPAI